MAPWRLLVLTLAVLSCAQALEIPPNWKQQCPITTIKVFTIVRPPLSVQAPAEGSGWDVKSGVEVCEDETHDQDTCAGIPCCQWDEDDKKCRSAVGTSTCMESVQRAYGKAGGDAAGFSHDFVNNVALSAFGQGQYAITSEFMPKGQQNNNGIFAKLRKSADDPTPTESCNPKKADGTFSCVVCLGVASISITAERETSLDFLPSYFQAGMKVLVESRIDMWKMIWGIVILLLQVLSQVLAFFLFFTLLLAPMVWVFEMMSMANTKGLPIFISRTEIDSEQRRLEEQWEDQTGDTPATLAEKQNFLRNGRTAFIETQSLMNAIQWTAYVLAGGTVAYPKSAVARGLRASAKGLQVFLGIMITASATSVLTVSTIEGKGAKISSFNDLANRKVCAESNTAPYNFLKSQKQVQLNVIEGIKNNRDMFWRFEQFGSDGKYDLSASQTCQAIVYDWPLLMGYINRNNQTALDTCFQCPNRASMVGQVLNADPYGIAMTQDHPLHEYLRGHSLNVIRDTATRKQMLQTWKLEDKEETLGQGDDDSSKVQALFWQYYGYAMLILMGLLVAWYLAFRSLRDKIKTENIDSELAASDGVDYMEEEAALLCSSQVMLSEDHELTHDIRLELNAVKRCLLSIMRKQEIAVLPQPRRDIYEHFTPTSRLASGVFDSFKQRSSGSVPDREGTAGTGVGAARGESAAANPSATVGHANSALLMSSLSQSAPLPPNWRESRDPGSGKVFYQNDVTKTTQWERPAVV